MNYAKLSLQTLLEYTGLSSKLVEENISNILTNKFPLLFDRWCEFRTNFIGCAIHCYNLAVKDIIETNMVDVEKIKKIMECISFHMRRAKLHEYTALAPVRCNKTCYHQCIQWSVAVWKIENYFLNSIYLSLMIIS